jgi:hypothetical protein
MAFSLKTFPYMEKQQHALPVAARAHQKIAPPSRAKRAQGKLQSFPMPPLRMTGERSAMRRLFFCLSLFIRPLFFLI